MKDIWRRIEDWFTANYPVMVDDLNRGSSAEAVTALENAVGLDLPKSLKDFYQIHDGQKANDFIGLFYNISLLPVGMIFEQWRIWSSIIDEHGPDGMFENFDQYQTSLMPRKVKPLYANKKWIPFGVIWDSNYLGLDFDPGPDGTYGQVINFGREEEQKAVLANSFSEFVQSFVDDLEAGEALIESNGDQFVFLPKKFESRFRGEGTRLLGYVAHRFIEEPTHEEQARLEILL